MKTDIDIRTIQCIEYLVKNKGYKSEKEFLKKMEFPESKLSEARKGKSSFRADDIGKILIVFEEINGHWIMTGKGDMLVSESYPTESAITQFLKKQNRELMEKIESLNREIGDLKRQITELKKGNVRPDAAAENADTGPYGLGK